MLNILLGLIVLMLVMAFVGGGCILIKAGVEECIDRDYTTGGIFMFLGVLILLLGLLPVVSIFSNDGIPYDVKYEKRCLLMEGEHTTERKWNAATKTTRTYHYCTINGNKFSDIGVK